jgi:hypothetical protein
MSKMWELSERELPRSWFRDGVADGASNARRAIAAALSVLRKQLTREDAIRHFHVAETPYQKAVRIVNASPEITKKTWANQKGFNLYDSVNKINEDTGCLYGCGENATLQEWWGMIDPDLRHEFWKMQAARLHPDRETGDAPKAAKFNEVSQKLKKQNLL